MSTVAASCRPATAVNTVAKRMSDIFWIGLGKLPEREGKRRDTGEHR
jgi:hypothetical protein